MGGHATVSNTAQKINNLQVQKSSFGVPVAIGWGRNRVNPNLIWYGAFNAVATTTSSSSGGKGGKVSQSQTTYTYFASLILLLGEGSMPSIRTVFRDKEVFTTGGTTALAQAGLSLAAGAVAQSVWGYLTTNFPSQAINYSELAYVYGANYQIGDNAGLQNHSFEVDFAIQMAGGADADPSLIVADFLSNTRYGVPQWTSALTGSLTLFQNYTLANNLLLSPLIDQQMAARDIIIEWLRATNCDAFWSEGVLKFGTYGDAAATANGQTYTPYLTPYYDFTTDDFIPSSANSDPVDYIEGTPADRKNTIQVEFLDRAKQYNTNIVTATDLADVDQYGSNKDPSPISLHSICDATIAQHAAQLILQRLLYVRGTYTFTVPQDYVLLDPMDLVTITDATLALSRKLVRIKTIKEDGAGNLTMECEPMNVGTAAAALRTPAGGSGYAPNYAADPGDVSVPFIFNPPVALTAGEPRSYAAVAGINPNWGGCNIWTSIDGTNYQMIGTQYGASRYGVLSAALAAGSDPDTVNTCSVDLTVSHGVLNSATLADVNASTTMFLIGSELMAYETATLGAAYHYNLTYLRRGVLTTAVAAHANAAPWVRLDQNVFQFPYLSTQAGQTVYVKFQSFNVYGGATRDISLCTAYSFIPNPVNAPAPESMAWSGAGTTFTAGTSSIPGILMTGACDNPDAEAMHFYFRVNGTSVWRPAGGLVSRNVTQVEITNLTAQTAYDVAVSNVVGGAEGALLSVGTFTSGFAQAPSTGPTSGTVLYSTTTPGSFSYTIPAGITSVKLHRYGGGGGGGGAGPSYGDFFGGGGGQYILDTVTVTAGQVITGSIGGGGGPGGFDDFAAGGTGGATTISAPGGLSGASPGYGGDRLSPGSGGAGGTGGTVVNGSAAAGTGYAGGASGGPYGQAGASAYAGAGAAPGAGGAGGFTGVGGNGGNGGVWIVVT
jgi:hypothetical protein